MVNRIITTFALLSANYIQKNQYIDLFIPFFAELFHEKRYEIINLECDNIIDDFKNMFGLELPRNVLITLLNRCCKKEILTRSNNLFSINYKNIDKYYNQTQKSTIERNIRAVLFNIKEYIKNKFNYDESINNIELSLLNILNKYDADILLAVNEKSVIPENNYRETKLEYMVYSYILDAEQKKPDDIERIIELVTGHILAETILFSNVDTMGVKKKKMTIYLDTPLLIDLLGYSGKFKELAIIELIVSLQAQGAKVCIFDITLNELKNIVYNCYTSLDNNNFDLSKSPSILRYCIENNISALIVSTLHNNIEKILASHNIEVIQQPDFNSNFSNIIDETKLENTIKNIYTLKSPLSSIRQETLNVDVKVLASIYFLSGRYRPRNIGECKHILITSNSGLVRSCKIFESDEFNINEFIPACITSIIMGTLLWIQSPQKFNNYNKLKFISDCYSAIQPDNEFIDKFMHEIHKLEVNNKISSEDVYYVRSLSFVQDFYHDIHGDYDYIQKDNINDLLRIHKQAIIDEAIKPINEELEKTKNSIDKLIEINKDLILKKNSRNKVNIRKAKCITNTISILIWVLYLLVFACGIIYIVISHFKSINLINELSFFKITSIIVVICSYIGLLIPIYKYNKKIKSFIFFHLFKKE